MKYTGQLIIQTTRDRSDWTKRRPTGKRLDQACVACVSMGQHVTVLHMLDPDWSKGPYIVLEEGSLLLIRILHISL